VNRHAEYFLHQIEVEGLVDIEPIAMRPTKRNNQIGVGNISKHLEIFLASDSLLQKVDIYRSWIEEGGISDHSPIFI
jgi:hypothetical protein